MSATAYALPKPAMSSWVDRLMSVISPNRGASSSATKPIKPSRWAQAPRDPQIQEWFTREAPVTPLVDPWFFAPPELPDEPDDAAAAANPEPEPVLTRNFLAPPMPRTMPERLALLGSHAASRSYEIITPCDDRLLNVFRSIPPEDRATAV